MMARRCQSSFAIALLSAACQVGKPLVDKFEAEPGIPKIQCGLPPPCEALSPKENPSHTAERVSLKPCTKLCQLGQVELGGCPEQPQQGFPINAMCQDFEFQPTGEAPELSLSGSDWVDVNLSLRAERPLRVLWSGGKLHHVFVELHGPVVLQIEQLEELEDLRIQGGSSPAGTPRVELADLTGNTLSVGAEDQPFAGQLTFRALQLSELDVRASSLVAESVNVVHANLRADSLTLTDVTLREALVDVKKVARLSVFGVEDTRLHFCGDVRAVDGSFRRSPMDVCPESTLKLYSCNVGSSSLDGRFELDGTSLENVRLAVSDPTRITAYNSRIESTKLCDNLELLAAGNGTVIKCSDCVDQLNDEASQPACVFEDVPDALHENFCPVWRALESVPICEDDVPRAPDRVR